jgi:hypothetical protein
MFFQNNVTPITFSKTFLIHKTIKHINHKKVESS